MRVFGVGKNILKLYDEAGYIDNYVEIKVI